MKAELQRSLRFGNWAYNIASKEIWWSLTSRNILRLGNGPDGRLTQVEAFSKRIHPDDRKFLNILFNRAVTSGVPFDVSFRLLIPDVDKMFAGGVAEDDDDYVTRRASNRYSKAKRKGEEYHGGEEAAEDERLLLGEGTEHLSSDGVPSVWCRMMCRVQFHSVTKRAEKLLGTIQDITSWAISVRAPQPTDRRKDGQGAMRIVNENHFVVDEEAKCTVC
uniref:PAS domain-containing protein n=1 Tax=Lotharella oceanica TaxID=641309 RepID=A0A7S2XBF5_9EUKA|mmetsp:Transcript_2595/g.4943  ORF Transcript_2595/g.4943 Transcript_2595/m.4943 type:complete len:219 (+) Transcript_2595:897-1553(+)